jgi:hypothetical protein
VAQRVGDRLGQVVEQHPATAQEDTRGGKQGQSTRGARNRVGWAGGGMWVCLLQTPVSSEALATA